MYRHQLGENLHWSHLGLKAQGLSGLRYVMLCYFMLCYVILCYHLLLRTILHIYMLAV